MKNILKSVLSTSLAFVLLLTNCSCQKLDNSNDNKSLQFQDDAKVNDNNNQENLEIITYDENAVFDLTAKAVGLQMFEAAPPYAVSCKIPSKYDLIYTRLPVLLSFGNIGECHAEKLGYSGVLVRAANDKDVIFTIKTLNADEIAKPEYKVECVLDADGKYAIDHIYSHTEIAYIPLSLFLEESGYITIGLCEFREDENGKMTLGSGGHTIIYYTRTETQIIFKIEK